MGKKKAKGLSSVDSTSSPLPVAVIGVGGFGGLMIQALLGSNLVKVVGVSDKDASEAQKVGQSVNVPYFSDNRSLMAEARPQAVYLAVPPPAIAELIPVCAERGIHVWKAPPLGRNLDEGMEFVRLMEEAGLKLAVGTQRRFAPGYRRAWELRGEVGRVFLARGHYLFNWGADLRWRGDKASAGGGALLELGYHMLDLMIWMLGVPDEVYGSTARGNRPATGEAVDKQLPVYDTDDTAAAILRYGAGSMAAVVTTRSSGPVSEELSLHGQAGSLTCNSEWFLLRDPDGKVLDTARSDLGATDLFRRQGEAFARAVLDGKARYECSGKENLLNLAAIEAIYLSDQTFQPENPLRLLKSRGLSVEECLQHRPASQP